VALLSAAGTGSRKSETLLRLIIVGHNHGGVDRSVVDENEGRILARSEEDIFLLFIHPGFMFETPKHD